MTTPSENDIKAGEYELLDLFWDEPTSKPTDPVFTSVRHYQGETVELDEEQAKRLVKAGSVAPKGQRQSAELEAAKARYLAALNALPDELRPHVEVPSLEDFANREVPVEELTVHTARGLTPEGSPRYASASSGEGTGGGDPQNPDQAPDENAGIGENPGDGRVDLGEAQGVADSATISEDDGTKNGRNARGRAGK